MDQFKQLDIENIKSMIPASLKENQMIKRKQYRSCFIILIIIMIVICVILGITEYVYKRNYSILMGKEYEAGKGQFVSQFKARKVNIDLLNAKAENSKLKKSVDDYKIQIQKIEGELSLTQEKIEALTIELSPIVKEMNERLSHLDTLTEQNKYYLQQINKHKE